MHAGAVGKPAVDQRARKIDSTTERRDEPLDEDEDLLRVGESDPGLLELSVAFDPDAFVPIDHDLRHALIAQQWGEIAEAEEPVVEPSLERPELAGRNDKTKVRQGLTKR